MTSDELGPTIEEAVRALAKAAQQLSVSRSAATNGVVNHENALDMVDAMERALSGLPLDAPGRDAVLTLRAARAELLAAQLARQRSMLLLVTRQIARIRSARTIDDLAESVAIETSALGYERAMFSWVEGEKWIPRACHTRSGPRESQAMLAAGGPPYRTVRDLNEVDVVRNRRAILVLDALDNPRVHPDITQVSHSVTYVAAPVIARNRVAAMVHADRNMDTGLNDEFDRDILALFAQNVGVALDRLIEPVGTQNEADQPTDFPADWMSALTPREQEVLGLLSSGLTNAQIGARLYVSEETVKTHVKKLMRKMGAHNRSQAGAMFHRQGHASAS